MTSSQKKPRLTTWREGIDVAVLVAWSALLLRYWVSGKLVLLLHPDYHWLAHLAAIALLTMAAFKGWQWFHSIRPKAGQRLTTPAAHITLLPTQWSSALLLGVAVFGLIYTPKVFASDTALQRGVSDTLLMTRSKPQSFVRHTPPEERTIIDWVRTLTVYPEPDAYSDQAVNVVGFIIHPPDWPDNYLMISRFVLSCCAADAYPVGLPVKLSGNRSEYPIDTWFQVEGRMATDELADQRQLVIQANALTAVPEPKNPYEY